MKLKYDLSTNEVICIGEMPELSGDGVVEGDFTIPAEPINHYTFDGTQLVRKEQEVIDKLEAEKNFSFKILMGRLNQELAPLSILKLAPYTGALQSYCDWKNWEGISEFLGGLVLSNIATQEEVDVVKAMFLEQGIVV